MQDFTLLRVSLLREFTVLKRVFQMRDDNLLWHHLWTPLYFPGYAISILPLGLASVPMGTVVNPFFPEWYVFGRASILTLLLLFSLGKGVMAKIVHFIYTFFSVYQQQPKELAISWNLNSLNAHWLLHFWISIISKSVNKQFLLKH